MHESHERDNLCHFRGERERERERETENGMKIVPYGVASFYLQPFPRTRRITFRGNRAEIRKFYSRKWRMIHKLLLSREKERCIYNTGIVVFFSFFLRGMRIFIRNEIHPFQSVSCQRHC